MVPWRPGDSEERQGQNGKKPEPEKGFDLWRILTTPEEMLDESERVASPAPVDSARVPVPEEKVAPEAMPEEVTVHCRKHPQDLAVALCPVCAAYYCKECLVIKKGRLLCKTCAETIYAPTEEEIIAKGENAYQHRGDFLPEAPPEFNPAGLMPGAEGSLANVFKRIVAFALDVAVARVLYLAGYVFLTLLLAGISKGAVPSVFQLGQGNIWLGTKVIWVSLFHYPFFFLVLVLDFMYFFLCFAIANRTPGMSWLNLRIVSAYGDFVGLDMCAIRAALLVATLGFSIITGLIHSRAMGLHDVAAGTYVINYSGLKRVDVYETINVKL
ncbi:MAG: hypothetical protein A2Y63_03055 [Candidatus Riflebacteria bacterium RBG_13_59_9]|nr:MAG: hypothetical protein A2Y63_03055 [Candidatus Riflebacteria bacterium RBG_13_59_9]